MRNYRPALAGWVLLLVATVLGECSPCRAAVRLLITGIPGEVYEVQSHAALNSLTSVPTGTIVTNVSGLLEVVLTNQASAFTRVKLLSDASPTNISQIAGLALFRDGGSSDAVALAREAAEGVALAAIAQRSALTHSNQLEGIVTLFASGAAARAAAYAQTNGTDAGNLAAQAAQRAFALMTNALPTTATNLPSDALARIQVLAALNGATAGVLAAGGTAVQANQAAQQSVHASPPYSGFTAGAIADIIDQAVAQIGASGNPFANNTIAAPPRPNPPSPPNIFVPPNKN